MFVAQIETKTTTQKYTALREREREKRGDRKKQEEFSHLCWFSSETGKLRGGCL
jgi:hypothetical protein